MGEDQAEKKPTTKSSMTPFRRKKQLEKDLEHVTQEMYKRNKELAETNKTLSLLRTIDALALESHASLQLVCEHITEAITQVTDYAFVGLLARSSHSHDELTLLGWSGSSLLNKKDQPLGFSRPVHVKMEHEWFSGYEDTKLITLEGRSSSLLAQFVNCSESDIQRVQENIPLKSLYVIKLMARRKVVGLLVIGFAPQISLLKDSDQQLLERLSDSIGVALDNKLLFEENQVVLRQLRETNKKLKELDETKDDFISMASHQLRTPLTSIKGYLSMVLEGDAGKITPVQKEMLSQAFFSSQRMVYLISDLLNVSRLKTGKFIIESNKINLAKVIQQELEQVEEMATSRQLTLQYDKPKDFPDLMLDDTKTRQVVMNFVDNAIYYTQAGGHITIKLLNHPSTIELRVEDNGLGVPKSEQPHLFTKFYRAGNARKARPDGTGLGLFMAKKIIVAQGGSIVFESKEGLGSTFGFILSKSKLLALAADHSPESTVAKAAKP
jgi:signal transduction histidine kinase